MKSFLLVSREGVVGKLAMVYSTSPVKILETKILARIQEPNNRIAIVGLLIESC